MWHRIPKETFVKLRTFEICVNDGVSHFHTGNMATLLIYDKLGLERGYWTEKGCYDNNIDRINNSSRKSTESNRARHCQLRDIRKCKNVQDKKKGREVIWCRHCCLIILLPLIIYLFIYLLIYSW